jgi:hypothetical protein
MSAFELTDLYREGIRSRWTVNGREAPQPVAEPGAELLGAFNPPGGSS